LEEETMAVFKFLLENIIHPRQINLNSENHLNMHMTICDPTGVF
jgi:hypothetical protein